MYIGNFQYTVYQKFAIYLVGSFVFQLRMYFVVYNPSEKFDIYWKFTMYFVDFFVPTLECILFYIYNGQIS